MRKLLCLLLFIVPLNLHAQCIGNCTSVTATLTDGNGQVWTNAVVNISIVPPFGNPAKLLNNGVPVNDPVNTLVTDGTGSFTISLDDNTKVSPANSRWNVSMCPNATVSNCSQGLIFISGPTQNISTSLNSYLNNVTVNAGPSVQRAYSDTEVNGGTGAIYWNTTNNLLEGCIGNPCIWTTIGNLGVPGVTGSVPFNNGFGVFVADNGIQWDNNNKIFLATHVKSKELDLVTSTVNLGTSSICNNYGDSISAGFYALPNNGVGAIYSTNGFAGLLAVAKGWNCNNQAVGGSQLMDPNITQAILTSTVLQNSLSTLVIGTNDMRTTYCAGCSGGMSTVTAQTQWEQGFMANLAWLAIPAGNNKVTGQGCPSTGVINCTFTGSGWGIPPSSWPSLVGKSNITPGDTLTINFSGTTAYYFYQEQLNNGATFSITIDGLSQGVFSSTGYMTQTLNTPSISWTPSILRFAGLNPGPHTLVFTSVTVPSPGVTGANYFIGFAVPTGIQRIGPYVFTANTFRAQSAGYASFGGSDALVTQFDLMEEDAVNQLASDGLHIQMVDDASVMSPQLNSLWYTDGFHPNTAGHAALAQAWEDAVTSILLPSDRGSSTITQKVFNGGSTGSISVESPQARYQPNRALVAESGGIAYYGSTGPNTSTKGGFKIRLLNSNGSSFLDALSIDNNGNIVGSTNIPIVTSFTTTAATTDNVAMTGVTASSHCSVTATNAGAAGGMASVFISNKTTNQITVTHTATAGWTFDVSCTPN